MKNLVILSFFTLTCSLSHGQVGGSSSTPNSGANTTVPPTNTFPTPENKMANPSNSTVPGSSGSYSTDPSKPDFNNPNTMGSYTVSPNGTGSTTTFSPQIGTGSQQKKKTKK